MIVRDFGINLILRFAENRLPFALTTSSFPLRCIAFNAIPFHLLIVSIFQQYSPPLQNSEQQSLY